jgi:hypothetical protein
MVDDRLDDGLAVNAVALGLQQMDALPCWCRVRS